MRTVVPRSASLPPGGSCVTTRPAEPDSETALPVSTVKPASATRRDASAAPRDDVPGLTDPAQAPLD